MTKEEQQKFLFSGRTNVFAVLDGASVKGLRMRMYELAPPNFCLFTGELEPDVAETAPYLVGLIDGTLFTDWILTENYGNHWGIFAQSRQSIIEMRRHFRSLVNVHDETGKPLIFRYYDPRVLQTFLPTCNAGELKTFFGKVDAFFAEESDGSGVSKFELSDGGLKKTPVNQ